MDTNLSPQKRGVPKTFSQDWQVAKGKSASSLWLVRLVSWEVEVLLGKLGEMTEVIEPGKVTSANMVILVSLVS